MAEPFDSAIDLLDVDAIIQKQYMPRFYELGGGRFGKVTNRLYTVNDDVAVAGGDGITMQAEIGPGDFARAQNDPLGGIAGPAVLQATSISLRYSPNDLTQNDFVQISASCQFDHWTIKNGKKGAIIDLAQRTFGSVMNSYDEHQAVLRNCDRTAKIALVNGTPKANNGVSYAAASSTATNATGIRFQVNSGILAVLRPNAYIDFIDATTKLVKAGNIHITDKFEGDQSIGAEFITAQVGGRISTGDLSLVATTDIIVFSGEYNAGLYGPGAYMTEATALEQFVGGKDRTTAGFRWMIPINPRYGQAQSKVARSMFDDVAIAMGNYVEDAPEGIVCQSDLSLTTAIRNELGEESFKIIPQSDERMRKLYQFGSTGLNYEHPSLGVIKIVGDALCPGNVVRFLDPSTWISTYYAQKGLYPLEGDKGSWYRMPSNVPGGGKGLIWRSDWVALQQDFCVTPKRNAQISKISAT